MILNSDILSLDLFLALHHANSSKKNSLILKFQIFIFELYNNMFKMLKKIIQILYINKILRK